MYEYNAVVTNVVDGDTFDLDVDLGFSIHHFVRVRLLNVDTPEKRGPEKELGLICTDYAKSKYLGESVVIQSKKINFDVNTDSFGRYLCRMRLADSDMWIDEAYSTLGINKYASNYSAESVRRLNIDF